MVELSTPLRLSVWVRHLRGRARHTLATVPAAFGVAAVVIVPAIRLLYCLDQRDLLDIPNDEPSP